MIVQEVLFSKLNSKYKKILDTKTNLDYLYNRINSLQEVMKELIYPYRSYSILSRKDRKKYEAFNAERRSLIENYNSQVPIYNKMLEEYNKYRDNNVDFINLKSSYVKETIIRNPSDKKEWLPGGAFKNSTFAGGNFYNPLALLDVKFDSRPKLDLTTAIMTGAVFSYLNKGYSDLKNTINSFGFLDLLNDYKISKTIIYNVRVQISSYELINQDIILNLRVDGNGDNSSNSSSVTSSKGTMNVSEINDAMNFQDDKSLVTDVLGVLGVHPSLALAIVTITDIVQAKEVQASTRVANFTINQAINTLSTALATKAVGILGITSIVGVLGILAVAKTVVTEAFEVAVGLDNHFGFGGEVVSLGKLGVKTDDYGATVHSRKQEFAEGFLDTIKEIASLGSAYTDTYNNPFNNFSNEEVDNAMAQADLSDYADNPQDLGTEDFSARDKLDSFNDALNEAMGGALGGGNSSMGGAEGGLGGAVGGGLGGGAGSGMGF